MAGFLRVHWEEDVNLFHWSQRIHHVPVSEAPESFARITTVPMSETMNPDTSGTSDCVRQLQWFEEKAHGFSPVSYPQIELLE